jgi:hypothetical protein
MNIGGSIFPRKLSAVRKLGLPVLLCTAFVCLLAGIISNLGDESWNLEEIENYLKVSIPKEARGLKYTSGTNRFVRVELSFEASPKSAIGFTSHFCDGILHQGYDPFNAINIDEQIPGSVKIDMIDYHIRSYYSYSPRTSQLKAGVFCYLYSGLYWVLIDTTDPASYMIRFKHMADRSPIYADMKPVADFPIMVRGLMPELHGGYSAFQRICLDLDPDAVNGADKKWSSLLGADIKILINGKEMPGAYVSNDGRLARKDGKSNYSDPDSHFFKYCLIVWQGGLHNMTIQLPPSFGGKSTYSWTFRELYSSNCGSNYPDQDCY